MCELQLYGKGCVVEFCHGSTQYNKHFIVTNVQSLIPALHNPDL